MSLENLAKIHGEDVSAIPVAIKNESSGGYYVHLPGDYQGLVSHFSISYVDKEGKRCKKDIPGATAKFAGLKLVVFKDPEKQLIDNTLTFDQKEDYGRLNYNIFIPLDGDKQWQNIRVFNSFTSNNLPEANVIQGKKNEEDVHLGNIPLYYGCPIKWEIIAGKKEDSRFHQEVVLLDNQTLTEELLTKRKAVADGINAKLDAYLEQLKAENKAKKETDKGKAPVSDAPDPDDFTAGLGIPNVNADAAASPNDKSDDLPY